MKNEFLNKALFISLVFTVCLSLCRPKDIYAVDLSCLPSPGGDNEIISSCTFPKIVSGVDTGVGATNSAKLIVTSGTLTVSSIQTVAFGTLEMGSTGSISIATGGQLLSGTPLWIVDADPLAGVVTGDGWPDTLAEFAQSSIQNNMKRRNTMLSLTTLDCSATLHNVTNNCCAQGTWYRDVDADGYGNPAGPTIVQCNPVPSGYAPDNTDCDDTNAAKFQTRTCYLDNDNDGVPTATQSSSVCVGYTCTNSANNYKAENPGVTVDCDDTNPNVFPGQTACFTSKRPGTAGYDYNCSGTDDICGEQVYAKDATVESWTKSCWNGTKYVCCSQGSNCGGIKTPKTCGTSGYYSGTYQLCGGCAKWYTSAGAAATQACN